MPIPQTRQDLKSQVSTAYEKLAKELDAGGPRVGRLLCVDDWTVRDLLAVRVWWAKHVIDWIDAGRRGERPVTPAVGYRWHETPRLNADIVRRSRRTSYRSLRSQLELGYQRVVDTIDDLDDTELLEVGVFAWCGKYPVARWISINTARQYTTARTFVRRARRQA